ncbi:hypothetical protein Tco_0319905 [Tanacetum coccineum]
MANLTDMLSKFVTSNTASTLGSGTLSGNTVTNPKEDLKGITTRSGVAYQGPAIPSTSSSSSKVMNRDTEVTKDKVLPTNNGGRFKEFSLTGFPAQSVGSSNTDVLDSPCLLVLITGTSQSRQHGFPSSLVEYLVITQMCWRDLKEMIA